MWYNGCATQKRIFLWGELSIFIGSLIPIYNQPNEFGKSADSAVGWRVIPSSRFCVATIGVYVFRCADFGWRTFYFLPRNNTFIGELNEKNHLCCYVGLHDFLVSSFVWK